MESRVEALELHIQHVQSDLVELKAGQRELTSAISGIGTAIADLRVKMADDRAEFIQRFTDNRSQVDQRFTDQGLKLAELPTKADLWSWKLQWTALGVALVAIVIGGIIGGLDWIKG
jgi:hypothetical protein